MPGEKPNITSGGVKLVKEFFGGNGGCESLMEFWKIELYFKRVEVWITAASPVMSVKLANMKGSELFHFMLCFHVFYLSCLLLEKLVTF